MNLIYKSIKDLTYYSQLGLDYQHNNINSRRIAFLSHTFAQLYGIEVGNWFKIVIDPPRTELVYIFSNDFIQDDQGFLFLHPELLNSLKPKNKTVQLFPLKEVQINEFKEDSRYNFMPNLTQCEKIVLVNICNKNTSVLTPEILRLILNQPFLITPGDCFSISIHQNIEDIIKLNPGIRRKMIKIHMKGNDDREIFKVVSVQIRQNNSPIIITEENRDKQVFHFFMADLLNTTVQILKNPINDYFDLKLLTKNENLLAKKLFKFENYQDIYIQFKQMFELGTMKSPSSKCRTFLFVAAKGSKKKLLLKHLALKFKINYLEKDLAKLTSLKHLNKSRVKAFNLRPCVFHLRNLKSLSHVNQSKNSDPSTSFEQTLQDFISQCNQEIQYINDSLPIFLVISMDKFNELNPSDNIIKNYFDSFLILKKISDHDHKELVTLILGQIPELEVFNVSKGFNCGQLQKITRQCSKQDFIKSFVKNIEKAKKSNDLENLSIPNVQWDDVGGLQDAKNEIIDTIMLPVLCPDMFDEYVKPRTGILFFGPPGTGKTMLAKCVATECKMNFLSIKGPELLNMYIGESEKNVRDIFSKAKKNAPCVIFFDELDALAPNRGQGSDSSQVMDRIVAQFMTELDSIDFKKGLLFVIGATNRPDLLDQSLLRPGRFDKMIYLGISEDQDQRIKILKAQTRKLKVDENVDFNKLIQEIPLNFTGADFYGLTSQSVIRSAKKLIKDIQLQFENERLQEPDLSFNQYIQIIQDNRKDLCEIKIKMEDFLETLLEITPSVSLQELEKYKELKQKFS